MERYNWQDRSGYSDDRSGYRDQEQQRLDESAYRGAYRLDTDSRHRNQTTYNGFDRHDQDPHQGTGQHGGNYVYRLSRNLQDNDHYTENQYRQSYGDSRSQRSDNNYRQQWHEQRSPQRSGFGSRYGGRAGMAGDQSHFGGDERQEGFRSHFGGSAGSNFNNDYGPDRYGSRGPGENYGNMAGSLSFGYDGDFNVDPYANRHYNPLSGELRSYRDQYVPRHPHRYGPPDKTGTNPDYDRY